MRRINNTPWIVGTIFVSFVIIAVGYFFGIAPKLEDAEDINDEAEAQESLNDILEMQVIQLRADFDKLDEYRAEIEDYEVGIPLEAQLPELLRITDELAEDADVILANTELPNPEEMNIPVEIEDGIDVDGLIRMPISYEVIGEYENIFAFLDALQQEYQRNVLIRDFDITIQEFDVAEDFDSFTYELRVDTDMYVMIKDGIPTTGEIDYDIPGVIEKGDDDGEDDGADSGDDGNADDGDEDSEDTDEEDDLLD